MNEDTKTAENSRAVVGPVERQVRPVAEVKSARLRWHLPTPDADPVAKFLDNETHPLYDQDALDAAVAAERERWVRAIADEPELPGPMPDEMWATMNGDRDATEEAMRTAVRLTKEGIRARARGA